MLLHRLGESFPAARPSMALLPGLCLFGLASAKDGTAFRYKILGIEAPARSYSIVLEVTNVITSYITKFSLMELMNAVTEECSIEPAAEDMLVWLRARFEDEVVEAATGGSGLQLVGVHHWDEYSIVIRLPPQGPLAPLLDAKGTAWVAQEVMFSMGEQLRATKRRLQACEQRCPPSQQMEDIAAFLAASQGQADADSAGAAPPSPAPARISQFKRKEAELETVPPVSGSAVKAARPSGRSGAADAAAAEASQQPASTQQTGGMSNSSRRLAEVGKPAEKKVAKPGRGMGRGRGTTIAVHRKK